MTRRFLVFFRAGNHSLHQRSIEQDPDRNWDCCVSWYGDPKNEPNVEYSITGGENKLEAFAEFYRKEASRLPYEYFFLVDDDVAFLPGQISRYFDYCTEHSLYLSQPALRWGTNSNHDVTLWNPLCLIRNSRYVEVMAPCFSREAIDTLIGTFTLTKSTWGIDIAWSSFLRNADKISIIDAIRVSHTKPVNLQSGAFYSKMKELGCDPFDDYAKIKSSQPGFGGFRSKPTGHIYHSGIHPRIGNRLFPITEKLKKTLHRCLISFRKIL